METVLAGLTRRRCFVYLDDILVISNTWEEDLSNIQQVLDRLHQAGLRLKPKKCSFAKRKANYLGHVVSENVIEPDPQKIEKVRDYPTPKNLKTLQQFLGLASNYRRYIPLFSKITAPLHALTRKTAAYVWTPLCQQAFDKLKELLTTSPVLAFPNFSQPFLLETDASGKGVGAVLSQRQEDCSIRPIAYASRTLQKHEANYGISELEALAVVWAVKHFRVYLYGHHCTVFTDHSALKSLLNTHPSGRLARWGLALQEMDLDIQYRLGKQNTNADTLSRMPPTNIQEEQAIAEVATVIPDCLTEGNEDGSWRQSQCDEETTAMIAYLESQILPTDEKQAKKVILTEQNFCLLDGILYHTEKDGKLRLVVPPIKREKLMQEAHAGIFSGHLREAKVYSQLQKHYWWPRMRSDVCQYCRSCLTCATRHTGRATKPPLTPIPVAGPFDCIGVDVIQFPQTYDGN